MGKFKKKSEAQLKKMSAGELKKYVETAERHEKAEKDKNALLSKAKAKSKK